MLENPLQDHVAIVTGAGHGIGAETARALGAAGIRVAVNDINPDRAEKVAAAIREAGGEALAITADVSNKFHCVNLVESTRQAWERLDILVNCAAVRPSDTILKMDEWTWQRAVDVNLKGVFLMCQLVGRVMVDENEERGGLIVNVGPAASAANDPNQAVYAAAKAGVIGFTEACAREFAPHNIRVYAVSPGPPQETAEKILQYI